MLPDFKLYYKAVVVRSVRYWHKHRHGFNGTELREPRNQPACLWSIGLPAGSVVKKPPANAGDGLSIPGSAGSPGEENDNPLWNSCWEIPWAEEQSIRHNLATKQQQCVYVSLNVTVYLSCLPLFSSGNCKVVFCVFDSIPVL